VTKLQRQIGLVALTLYGVGDILGSGVYGLIGKAAGQMGNFVWLAFLFSFLVALMTGLSYAALGSRYPKAAGSSLIVWHAFRSPLFAFVVGLATLCSGLTSMAAASRVFAGYFSGMLPFIPENGAVFMFACAVAFIVFIGIGVSIWVNAVCTAVELTGLLIIIIAGLPYLGTVNLADVSSIPSGSLTPSLVLSGAVLTFFSFVGFEDILNVGEEVKDAERTLPRALVYSLLIASTIYFLVAAVAVSVVPAAQLGASSQPLVEVIKTAWPWFPIHIFSLIAMFAVANTALLNFIMGSRLLYGLGKLGLAPEFLSHVHKKTKTPMNAVLVVLTILLILAFTAEVSQLARATSILILLVFIGMHASLIRFQLKEKKRHKWHLPWAVPVIGILGAGAMLAHVNLGDVAIAGTMIGVILLLYFIRRPTVAQIEKFESL
jgi:amino acid transporter